METMFTFTLSPGAAGAVIVVGGGVFWFMAKLYAKVAVLETEIRDIKKHVDSLFDRLNDAISKALNGRK